MYGLALSSSGCIGQADPSLAECSPSQLELCHRSEGYANPYPDQLELLDWPSTLRKASLNLAGTLPTQTQIQVTQDFSQDGLVGALAEVMRRPEFFTRLREHFNDLFLTDKYLGRQNALSLLSDEVYPNLHWYEGSSGDKEALELLTNDGVAREVLDLIAHIVGNDLSFQEILTADYTVMNAYAARAIVGAPNVPLPLGTHPEEPRPVRVPGVHHAGLLTSPMFLNRFPTSDTNVNRHRARMVYAFFLDSDVEALAGRPIDAGATDIPNPTYNNPDCAVCHGVLDPLAGTFKNWDDRGRFRHRRNWYDDMRPPGFGGEVLPEEASEASLAWVAQRIARHPNFARAMTRIAYTLLVGEAPLDLKAVDALDPNYAAYQRAVDVQEAALKTAAERFVASGYNFRVLLTEIALTPYFRAANTLPVDELQAVELAAFGTETLLTPERLNRRIQALTGTRWRRNDVAQDYLLGEYLLFYGGIDSDQVTQRIDEPNGLMASLSDRMAYEVACRAVAADWARGADRRQLLAGIGTTPTEDEATLRDVLVHLHFQLLGELLNPTDPEIDASLTLFQGLRRAGLESLASGEAPAELPQPCRRSHDPDSGDELSGDRIVAQDPDYWIRAWVGMLHYLLSDYEFLYG